MSLSKSAISIIAAPLKDLRNLKAIVLDWHDGPVDGFLKFATPASAWRFQLLAERHEDDDVDSRLYLLSEVPVAMWEKLREALEDQERNSGPLWIPSWQFDSNESRIMADKTVADLENSAGSPEFVVRASGNLNIDEIWLARNSSAAS